MVSDNAEPEEPNRFLAKLDGIDLENTPKDQLIRIVNMLKTLNKARIDTIKALTKHNAMLIKKAGILENNVKIVRARSNS